MLSDSARRTVPEQVGFVPLRLLAPVLHDQAAEDAVVPGHVEVAADPLRANPAGAAQLDLKSSCPRRSAVQLARRQRGLLGVGRRPLRHAGGALQSSSSRSRARGAGETFRPEPHWRRRFTRTAHPSGMPRATSSTTSHLNTPAALGGAYLLPVQQNYPRGPTLPSSPHSYFTAYSAISSTALHLAPATAPPAGRRVLAAAEPRLAPEAASRV
jgi:hypothetical protein